jgi:hypothetical protein
MPEVTFREYAMAVMQNQLPTAVAQLQTLLGLSEDHATAATTFFKQRVGDPTFMPKAMSLRQAVTSGSDAEIGDILVECFGLDASQRTTAVATVRVHYPLAT